MSALKADRWFSSWFERRIGPLNLFVFMITPSRRWRWGVMHRRPADVGKGEEHDEKTAKLEARRCAERWLLAKGKEAR